MTYQVSSERLTPEERRRMEEIAGALPTKSAKIRALDAAGYKRARIADFLNIRYQHVRNVLVSRAFDEARSSARTRLRDETRDEMSGETLTYGRGIVDENGRVAFPAAVLDALEVRPGGWIPWRFEDGELKLMNRAAALRFGQSLAADLARKRPGSWSDQLIAERRAEAAREDAERSHD
jgi:hypothetical protein